MQHLAEAAGLNRSTICRALRDHPRISAKTREHVRAIADRLGYRTNPLVSALMSFRKAARNPDVHTTLAYLTNWPADRPWRQFNTFLKMFEGAKARAYNRGYRLEEFSVTQAGMTPARVADILQARGIHGVLVGPLYQAHTELAFPWEKFSAVVLTFTLVEPPLLHIITDHYHSMLIALRECRLLGSRRPGLVLNHQMNERVEGRWLAAYLAEQFTRPLTERPAPLIVNRATFSRRQLRQWLRQQQPDFIIEFSDLPLKEWKECIAEVAPKIRWANLDVKEPDGSVAGIFQDFIQIGAVAADQLIARVERNKLGPLAQAQSFMIDGRWIPGATAKPITG